MTLRGGIWVPGGGPETNTHKYRLGPGFLGSPAAVGDSERAGLLWPRGSRNRSVAVRCMPKPIPLGRACLGHAGGAKRGSTTLLPTTPTPPLQGCAPTLWVVLLFLPSRAGTIGKIIVVHKNGLGILELKHTRTRRRQEAEHTGQQQQQQKRSSGEAEKRSSGATTTKAEYVPNKSVIVP